MLDPSNHVVEHVDAYLHEALSEADREIVERHCAECRICQVALEEAQKRMDLLMSVAPCEASEELIRESLEGIDKPRPRPLAKVAKVFWSAVAAAALILAVVNIYYASISPSSYDLVVLGQTKLLPAVEASMRVRLVDRNTGEGVPGVPVEMMLCRSDLAQPFQIGEFTTDQGGTGEPRLRIPDWPDGDYELRVTARGDGIDETIIRTVTLKRSWKLMLSTDKPVYQPGQTIHLRSLALRRPDLKPVGGHEALFSITDPKGNLIFKQPGVNSEYGIASADCPLATEIIEGSYTIECAVGDTTSTATVEVKRYVLPKFKIDVQLDRPFYAPGEKLGGSVAASYFFGKPAAGGRVEVLLQTDDARAETLDRSSFRLDDEGKGDFEFLLPDSLVGREEDSGDAAVRLEVAVRDAAGQGQSRSVRCVVTASPIHIEVIPESGELVEGVPNTVYLFTTYADGRPAQARLSITGQAEDLRTSRLGVASVEVTPRSNWLQWTIRATDDAGLVGHRRVTLPFGHVPGDFPRATEKGGESADFLVRTDKAVYEGGETLQLTVLGGGKEPVFVDFIKDGQTLLTRTVDMADGRGQMQLDLSAELSGTVQICAYRFGKSGVPYRKTRVVYVRAAGELSIRTELDRAEYRPGDRATLRLAVTDAEGRPAPGALSLAVVDEAVFSVLDRRPGLEQEFFTLDEELLEPVYALYAWSPDAPAAAPEHQWQELEQALFAYASARRGAGDPRMREFVDKYLEGDDRALEVLQRPDWEELANPAWFPEEAIEWLRNRNLPHSLMASSYPAKARETAGRRETGIAASKTGWTILGALAFVGLLVTLLTYDDRWGCLFAFLFGALFVALMLPAVQAVRESARRTSAMNDLKQIGVGLEMQEAARRESGEDADVGGASQPRVRQWFPETLLWCPELIIDDKGEATIDVDLADSITTWRLTASAVTAEGKLGGTQEPIRVFQPFFVDLDLPVALTRGDEVAIPVVVYNYLDQPQTVHLSLQEADWFELLDEPGKTVELAARQVQAAHYRVRVNKVGSHELLVTARAEGGADAIKRTVEVVPDGRLVEQVTSGTLSRPAEVALNVPEDAIEGSAKAIVKIYPSSFSQLVEGLDAIFQRPYGCFEQTSSTTYPNVLALDYLRRTNKSVPEVELKARQYIHLGYQRLLTFEVGGGGFDWFGRPPANRTLTAYGLMEFEDMARVHDVDPSLIERTRRWLLDQQGRDGSWRPEGHGLHEDPTRAGGRETARLSTTAYIAWAVFRGHPNSRGAAAALDFLRSHRPQSIDSPYVLALVCNALLAVDPSGREARPYLDQLLSMRRSARAGQVVWWSQGPDQRTVFYGGGRSGDVETTAMAALALLAAERDPAVTRGALAWLVEQKDGSGTWHSTQATVLAFKALLAGTGRSLGGNRERRVDISLDGELLRTIVIPPDQADVLQQHVITDLASGRSHRLVLTDRSNAGSGFQVTFRHHVPDNGVPPAQEPLSIEVAYDRTALPLTATVAATATVVNNLPEDAPMVLLDLPIPPGFAVQRRDFDDMVAKGTIARYQLTPRSVIVYLRGLAPGKPLVLRYGLRPTMPVRVTAAPAEAYLYYDPDVRSTSRPTRFTVSEGVPL